jgi:Cu+-exporting ATPase
MRNSLFIGLILTLFACNSNTQIQAKKTVQPTITAKANKTIELEIEGMVCEMGCGSSIRKELKNTHAVAQCSFDFKEDRKQNTASISYDSTKITSKKIVAMVEKLNDGQFKVIPE